jgi:hypothetical protein
MDRETYTLWLPILNPHISMAIQGSNNFESIIYLHSFPKKLSFFFERQHFNLKNKY